MAPSLTELVGARQTWNNYTSKCITTAWETCSDRKRTHSQSERIEQGDLMTLFACHIPPCMLPTPQDRSVMWLMHPLWWEKKSQTIPRKYQHLFTEGELYIALWNRPCEKRKIEKMVPSFLKEMGQTCRKKGLRISEFKLFIEKQNLRKAQWLAQGHIAY